ncbi:hypothetical protein KUTeg_001726 [Tegillarca granosa]|uniref:Uncharacterized protein n=1 Tax=Tegillarca granosa TaxID=220873 RepID=A0ABQ9FSA2_TEGGR|nr:hypothetical protein KUTeg_001726 [Tegillarca granosa]
MISNNKYYNCGPLSGKLFVIAAVLNLFLLLVLQLIWPKQTSIKKEVIVKQEQGIEKAPEFYKSNKLGHSMNDEFMTVSKELTTVNCYKALRDVLEFSVVCPCTS